MAHDSGVFILVTPSGDGHEYRPMYIENINDIYNNHDEIIPSALWTQFSSAPVYYIMENAYQVARNLADQNNTIINKITYGTIYGEE